MTKENTLAVNSLPSPTWNRLHMNETTVTLPPLDGSCKADWSGAEVTAAPAPATVVSTGMGQEAEAAFASLETDRITAKANTDTTARLTLCADGAKNARRVELTAEANSHLTVVMDLQSTADAPCLALETRVELAPGAKVRLVQLSLPGTDCTVVNNIWRPLRCRCRLSAGAVVFGRQSHLRRVQDSPGRRRQPLYGRHRLPGHRGSHL